MIQKDDNISIAVGDCESSGEVFSDRCESWYDRIESIKLLNLYLDKDRLVGFKSVYVDKLGTLLEGKALLSFSELSLREL
jgi:hypothetical protein